MKDQKYHSEIAKIPVGSVIADGGRNPRTVFDEDKLFDLGNSISETTQLQPIIVNEIDGKYHLVAGERRLRSAREAGQELIEAKIFKDLEPIDTLVMSLDENHQRVHLNVIEEAGGMKQLLEHGKTEDWIAERYGYKTRDIVRQRLSLLTLPPDVQKTMTREHNPLPIKQALLLVSLPETNQIQLAREIAPKTGPVVGIEYAKELVDNTMGKKLPGMEKVDPVDKTARGSAVSRADERTSADQTDKVSETHPLKTSKTKTPSSIKPMNGAMAASGKFIIDEESGSILLIKATITVKVGSDVEVLSQDELRLGLDMAGDNNNRDTAIKLIKKAAKKLEKKKANKKKTTRKKVVKKKSSKKSGSKRKSNE